MEKPISSPETQIDQGLDSEIAKLQAIVEPHPIVAGLKLRPFGGGTYALLKIVGNPIIDQTSKDIPEDTVPFHIGSFLYIHHEPIEEVGAAVQNLQEYKVKVFKFMDEKVSMKQLMEAAPKIRDMIVKGSIGLDYQVEQDATSPN